MVVHIYRRIHRAGRKTRESSLQEQDADVTTQPWARWLVLRAGIAERLKTGNSCYWNAGVTKSQWFWSLGMAVSQYLRPESLLGEMRTHLTPGIVHSAS